ncbi:hypothetical protein [Butyrivibrio sp. AE3004]|uniref:hypothetical protein n=1 Tax=Butyrivibrio sp. AE3004 TaxID=1506994 RepID=UPI000A707B30|nr:hypothetical protein [Butyrivibrio sp. AE3004]
MKNQKESVEHLCAKCDNYSKEWGPVADDIWAHQKHYRKSYENYAKEKYRKRRKKLEFPDVKESKKKENRGA